MRMPKSVLLPLLASPGLAGCGHAGPTTVAIQSTAVLDGYVTATGLVQAGDVGMSAGDSASNDTARMFVSFPLDQVPAGATVQRAMLEMRQIAVQGGPYAELGPLVLDHVDYGASLDRGDYATGALSAAFAEFATNATLEAKTRDVRRQVEADLASRRTRSDFRLRFVAATDGHADADYARFATAESTSDQPVLRVTYLP
jgi:hypothetical protein